MTRPLDFIRKLFGGEPEFVQQEYSFVTEAAEKHPLYLMEARIAALERKVKALSSPQEARDWDAFKVPSNLPTYTNNTTGRFPSDIQADKTMVGDDE